MDITKTLADTTTLTSGMNNYGGAPGAGSTTHIPAKSEKLPTYYQYVSPLNKDSERLESTRGMAPTKDDATRSVSIGDDVVDKATGEQENRDNLIALETNNRHVAPMFNYYAQFAPAWNRFASATGMNADETLHASRRADAFNNKLRWNSADPVLVTQQGVSGGIRPYRKDSIQTADIKQQGVNERTQAQALTGLTNLQAAVGQLPYEVQHQVTNNMLDLSKRIGVNTTDFANFMDRMYADISFNLPVHEAINEQALEYRTLLAKHIGEREAQNIYNALKNNTTYANYYSKIMSGYNVSAETLLDQQVWDEILHDKSMEGMPASQKMLAVQFAFAQLSSLYAKSWLNGAMLPVFSNGIGD